MPRLSLLPLAQFRIVCGDIGSLGEFDERYVSYCDRDTDFVGSLAMSGVPLWWTHGARAYHQYQPHFMPPEHEIVSLLANTAAPPQELGEPSIPIG